MEVPKEATHKAQVKLPEPPPEKKEGWWSIADIKGAPDRVIALVTARADIPDHWKSSIAAQVQASCAGKNFVWLDAHFFIEAGKANLHLTIEPDSVA